MKIPTFLYFTTFLLALSSCREERDLTYQGPTLVEFSNPISGTNSKLTGPSIGGISTVGDNPNIPIRGDQDSLVIQLVGPQRDQAIDVSYTVAPSTAVEGTDYEILGTKGTVTIAPRTSATSIKLRLLNHSTTYTDVKQVSFQISGTSAADISVSENYKTYALSIFPMKAYIDVTLGSTAGFYFSSMDGNVYDDLDGHPALPDIAFTLEDQVPVLVSPKTLSGNPLASATHYSKRVFTPAETVPAYLLQSWATTQLGSITAENIAAIPVAGNTATAATQDKVTAEQDGIYGFVSGTGKKGYIRVKSVPNESSASFTFDVMVQP